MYDFMGKLLSEMILDMGKCTCTFTFMRIPEVQNRFRMQFSHKVIYNYYSKKNWGCFGQYLKSKKVDFPLYFLKRIGPMSGVIFTSES